MTIPISILNSKQKDYNLYISDLKDYYFDSIGMYADPKVARVRKLFEYRNADISNEKLEKILKTNHKKYFHRYPHFINSSILLLGFAYLESTLCELAELCLSANGHPKKLSPTNSSIKIYRDVIIKYGKIKVDDLQNTWEQLLQYKFVRNLFIHNNSDLDKLVSASALNALKNDPNFHITSNHKLRINNPVFCINYLEMIYCYLEQIIIRLSDGKVKPKSIVTSKEIRRKEYKELEKLNAGLPFIMWKKKKNRI